MSKQAPRILALFNKRIAGDDALLELARLRFAKAGLGPEFYAATPEELSWLLQFNPFPQARAAVHLPREIDLFTRDGCDRFLDFAGRFGDKIFGFIVHDQAEIPDQREAYLAALKKINVRLGAMPAKPLLFIEYAVGLEPDFFCGLMESIKDLDMVSACLDIGHLGTRCIRDKFEKLYPGLNICGLQPTDPELPSYIEAVEESVGVALPLVIEVVERLAKLNKPLHLHLHDGHPLSTFSPFGVSDHLSFSQTIPIPFKYKGGTSLAPMFGPQGLAAIVEKSLQALPANLLSFTLEIHPTAERASLEAWREQLFSHWRDTTNAELQNNWLSVLIRNHELLQEAMNACLV